MEIQKSEICFKIKSNVALTDSIFTIPIKPLMQELFKHFKQRHVKSGT